MRGRRRDRAPPTADSPPFAYHTCGRPWTRGLVCGLMTALGGLGHTLPYLIPHVNVATSVAVAVVLVELGAISYNRHAPDLAIPCPVGPGDRRVVALLLPRLAARRGVEGGPRGQAERGGRHGARRDLPGRVADLDALARRHPHRRRRRHPRLCLTN